VFLFVTVSSAVTVGFVESTLRRELAALSIEELAELEVGLMQGVVDHDRLAALAKVLDSAHTEVHIALRTWRADEATPWAVVGARSHIVWPAEPPAYDGQTVRLDRTHRLRATTVDARVREPDGTVHEERIRAEILLDGTPRAAELQRLGATLVGVVLAAGVAVALSGLVFARRLARLLEQVAASAATARLDAAVEPSAPLRAPDEIRHVAESFRESVAQMRAQHSRNLLLTAGLAHELRSPLQNLVSEAEVALMRPRDESAYRKLVAGQLEELRALALVVDNLITLTALRDTAALPRHETFDLATQIAMRLSHEEHEGARRGIVVDVLHHGVCTIDGDREALVLMLRNLVGNAVRWTRDDTAVVLTIDGRADDLVVTVDDHGPGVPPSEREAIFEAFYQGPSPDGARAGYGLGLALARTAARSQGGEIHVETADTGGARFHVRLPRRGARARVGA
jgi:signal transduction histidine kinase